MHAVGTWRVAGGPISYSNVETPSMNSDRVPLPPPRRATCCIRYVLSNPSSASAGGCRLGVRVMTYYTPGVHRVIL
jgi:hypothetical protein